MKHRNNKPYDCLFYKAGPDCVYKWNSIWLPEQVPPKVWALKIGTQRAVYKSMKSLK